MIDIPIVDNNNRRAILSIRRGQSAFAAWKDRTENPPGYRKMFNSLWFRSLLLSLVGMLLSPVGMAAEILAVPTADQEVTISIRGPIVKGDADTFARFLTDAGKMGVVTKVTLNSPGGLLDEALKIAATVRNHGFSTEVAAGSMCASGCFIIFAAGKEKFAGEGAQIGTHSTKYAATGMEAAAETIAMARVLRDYGVPYGIVGRTVTTTPDKMAWLTGNELQSMGVQPAAAGTRLAPSVAVGLYVVQVASQRSETEAQASFRVLQSRFPNELGDREAIVRRVDTGPYGVNYRAMVGPFGTVGDADQFCSELKAAGGQCIVQRFP